METNFLVYIISHITITGYKTKTTTALHAFKIHHKLSVISSLNNACPYPEPALTHLSVTEHWICSQTCHTNLLIVYSLYLSISVYPIHSCIFRNCTPAFLSFALFKLHILQLYQSYFLIQESHYIGGSGGIRTHTAWRPRCRFGHLGPTRLETTSLCGFVDSRRTPAP